MPTTRTPARYSLARAYVAAHREQLIRENLSYIEFGSREVEFVPVDAKESILPTVAEAWANLCGMPSNAPSFLHDVMAAAYADAVAREAVAPVGSEVAIVTSKALVPVSGLKTERMTYTEPEPVKVSVTGGSTPTVAILSALDAALTIVRETNKDIPTALAVVISTGRGKFHGSFQASQWEDTDESGQVLGKRHELVMSSESLARGGKDTLVTLIHEAMHAQAHATGVKDTSRQGRFHNDKFRSLAEGAGLTCTKDSGGSTTTTGLQTWAEKLYAPVIAALDEVLTTHRIKVTDKPVSAKSTVRVQCGCQSPVTLPSSGSRIMDKTTCCARCATLPGRTATSTPSTKRGLF